MRFSQSISASYSGETTFSTGAPTDTDRTGPSASSPDFVGIAFEDDRVQGDKQNVNLRFPTDYMLKAEQ